MLRGRTRASVTQQVQLEEERLQRYRRALPRDDQLLFDQLFAFARKRIAATAMAADPLPMQTLLLTMLIGLFHLLAQVHARLARLEKAAPAPNDSRPSLPSRLDT